jgi:membrane-bound serine protease (ClpP class)
MVGMDGKAHGELAPDGMVKIKGELWSARSEEGNIRHGEKITVTGEDGLKLIVRKA